ncbi:MAG: hypothetical protein L0027_03465, partial [Candidatus Rokubacteria bacterium]|nr:hypothetical protein [Candidatus Rokubacteria bacterium]
MGGRRSRAPAGAILLALILTAGGPGNPAHAFAGAAVERRVTGTAATWAPVERHGAWTPTVGEALAGGAWGTGTLTDDEILDLVSRMTLSEEIAMVQGAPDTTCTGAYVSPSVQGCMGQAGYVPGVSRLGIPPLRLADGPAGVRLGHVATALPSPIGLAATFDRGAALLYGQVIGREGRALNQDVILAPMINQVSIPTA